jgi:transcriptional regulator with XRE-family HTH domain
MNLKDIKLSKLRNEAGLTQQALSDKSGINRAYIARLEGIDIENMSIKTLSDYVNPLGYQLDLVPLESESGNWKKLI